jgi:hypothetical protein
MPSLLRVLNPRSIGGMSGAQCQLAYFDRLTPDRQATAIARGSLPAATSIGAPRTEGQSMVARGATNASSAIELRNQ